MPPPIYRFSLWAHHFAHLRQNPSKMRRCVVCELLPSHIFGNYGGFRRGITYKCP
jgi:hypothetical protein